MGGFDSFGAYSARNRTDADMISWREALVPISIFCNPVLCSGALSSQLDLELGLTLTGPGGGRSRSVRQPGSAGRSRRVPRARSAAQLVTGGAARPLTGSVSASAASPLGRRGSVQAPQGSDPPSHILLTPAELHGPSESAVRPAGAGLQPPARPLRRSLDDRMLRPRPAPPEPAAGSQRLPRRSQERGSRDQQWAPAPPRSPRHALLQQHVKHISLQRLPLPGVPLRPRPVSLQETQLCLDRVSLEVAPLFQPTAAEQRPPQYQISPPEEGEPPVYHSPPTEQPPQRCAWARRRPPPAGPRVSLQETGAHGAGRDGQRRGRKCGVSGQHPGAQGRPWTLDLAELAEK
ncbi:hypothetical protein FJT64_024853 [Amphibalanus amphitrite]|uniref:Uncharacterized protein n=1 Tax=Amphibalanus amphitrite TaxID=1232801 RepID=A0A6A4WD39_AMPAM|nr:hypothetical protein FJT64_024853 [Amphibalanus amphitrite]